MIDKTFNIVKWFSGLSNSVKVMVVLLFLVIWFGYREYQSNISEKEMLKETIRHERDVSENCEDEKKKIINKVMGINNTKKIIDSVKNMNNEF